MEVLPRDDGERPLSSSSWTSSSSRCGSARSTGSSSSGRVVVRVPSRGRQQQKEEETFFMDHLQDCDQHPVTRASSRDGESQSRRRARAPPADFDRDYEAEEAHAMEAAERTVWGKEEGHECQRNEGSVGSGVRKAEMDSALAPLHTGGVERIQSPLLKQQGRRQQGRRRRRREQEKQPHPEQQEQYGQPPTPPPLPVPSAHSSPTAPAPSQEEGLPSGRDALASLLAEALSADQESAVLRGELSTYLAGVKDRVDEEGEKTVLFPQRFDHIVSMMGREDIAADDTGAVDEAGDSKEQQQQDGQQRPRETQARHRKRGKHQHQQDEAQEGEGEAKAPPAPWARYLLQEGIDRMGPYARYKGMFVDEQTDEEKLRLGLAKIRELDFKLARKTERLRNVRASAVAAAAAAAAAGEAREAAAAAGAAAAEREFESKASSRSTGTSTGRAKARSGGTAAGRASPRSIADSDLYASSEALTDARSAFSQGGGGEEEYDDDDHHHHHQQQQQQQHSEQSQQGRRQREADERAIEEGLPSARSARSVGSVHSTASARSSATSQRSSDTKDSSGRAFLTQRFGEKRGSGLASQASEKSLDGDGDGERARGSSSSNSRSRSNSKRSRKDRARGGPEGRRRKCDQSQASVASSSSPSTVRGDAPASNRGSETQKRDFLAENVEAAATGRRRCSEEQEAFIARLLADDEGGAGSSGGAGGAGGNGNQEPSSPQGVWAEMARYGPGPEDEQRLADIDAALSRLAAEEGRTTGGLGGSTGVGTDASEAAALAADAVAATTAGRQEEQEREGAGRTAPEPGDEYLRGERASRLQREREGGVDAALRALREAPLSVELAKGSFRRGAGLEGMLQRQAREGGTVAVVAQPVGQLELLRVLQQAKESMAAAAAAAAANAAAGGGGEGGEGVPQMQLAPRADVEALLRSKEVRVAMEALARQREQGRHKSTREQAAVAEEGGGGSCEDDSGADETGVRPGGGGEGGGGEGREEAKEQLQRGAEQVHNGEGERADHPCLPQKARKKQKKRDKRAIIF